MKSSCLITSNSLAKTMQLAKVLSRPFSYIYVEIIHFSQQTSKTEKYWKDKDANPFIASSPCSGVCHGAYKEGTLRARLWRGGHHRGLGSHRFVTWGSFLKA
jgi:hypothetical protein